MSPSPNTIYDEARHYDLLMPGPGDLPFYLRQFERYGGPVLELACGTGRLTIPLRQQGADITGLDSSESMLIEARAKTERSSITIEFVQADARDFSLNRRFGLIFIAQNTLCHMLRNEDVEAMLRCVQSHLNPGGRFVLDVFTPSLQILSRSPSEQSSIGEYDDPERPDHILVTESHRYDPATQINHIVWHYMRQQSGETWDIPLDMRMFYPQELDALLRYNGYVIEHKFGDFNESPFSAGSQKQLIVCRTQA